MKRSVVFIPVILIVLFLMNTFFAPKENGPNKNTKKKGKAGSELKIASRPVPEVNVVYRSTDGGETWQDISAGLPLDQQRDGFSEVNVFANERGLFLSAGNGIYHNAPKSTSASWKKETSLYKAGRIAPGKNGIYAFNYEGQILKQVNGTRVWSPMYTNFKGDVRSVFESASGAVFIGSDNGLFKSADSGKTWKQVHARGWIGNLVESDGLLLAAGIGGILRSADGGEKWNYVLNEGGVGITIEPIKGGFAAITANTSLMARTIRASYDGGKTWKPIDTGLPADLRTASIIQAGNDFFCGHPAGIFKSSDKGKTWKLLLPSIKDKVFNLLVSGEAIYAIPRAGGC